VAIDPNCSKRASIVACEAHGLVLGGPGSGKTTVALRKAVSRIQSGLADGQTVLFLSFSRAAVTRVLDAAKLEVPRKDLVRLTVDTFHAFFWRVLKAHGYLLGAPRKLTILLPQDEKALSGGMDSSDAGWTSWIAERERLFRQEGRVCFDLFGPSVAELLARCAHLGPLVGATYPLIIVDEAQDTGTHSWRCVELLSKHAQILCLADLDQQIYDFLPGVGPQRVVEIRDALRPFEVDLGTDNGRSPDSEILSFANDILEDRPRGAPYKGVRTLRYNPKNANWNTLLRRALKTAFDEAKQVGRDGPKSIAVLTDTGANALHASKALSAVGDANAGKAIRHKLHFDEAEALLIARLAAFLLEPKTLAKRDEDIATCMTLLADAKLATGTGKTDVQTMLRQSRELRAGKASKAGIVKALRNALARLYEQGFVGVPGTDWLSVKTALRETGDKSLVRAALQLDYMVAFQRGHRISAGLSEEWLRDGAYTRARAALDVALAQEQILDGSEPPLGIHVMNVHKSKGKQFDAVVLVRQARATGKGDWASTFVWRGDSEPYAKSRRILRVGASRAREHLVILDPLYPSCPLLTGHSLG
jgi:DNA helicase II / ATP-dependent DNA helicase PcrA